jgi:hypothetical protein
MGAAIMAVLEALGMASWMAAIRAFMASIMAWVALNLVSTGIRMAVATAVLTGWAAFLAVVTTGMFNFDGHNVRQFLFTNPIEGIPHDMYALFCMVFPFSFFVRLVCAYVVWKLTYQAAAVVVMRGIKFLFGG